jgi:glutathione synthase/RimK-type ligase-like ATP-grasp enzyme
VIVARIALVTDTASANLDEDLPLLVDALESAGAEPFVACWDDRSVDWGACAVAVVRSPWQYHEMRDEFCGWARSVESQTRLCNPSAVIEWNTDKRYLLDLSKAGIACTPTTIIHRGDGPIPFPAGELVVKPTVSAGSKNTARYRPADHEAASAHVAHLLAIGKTPMIQPYLRDVDTTGETALVYIDGELSHGLRKGPLLRAGAGLVEGVFAIETMSPRTPSGAERDLGARVITHLTERFDETLLYARVDLIPNGADGPVVLEVELTEPSLFHDYAPGSADRFAAAILRRA